MMDGAPALLASAFLHASWNALLKRELAPERAVVGALAAALLAAAAAAAALPGRGFPARAALLWTLGAGAFEGLYFATLAAALQRASYGAVYAVARGGALALVWPAAVLLLREPVTPRGAGGAGLVCLGVVLVAVAGSERASRAGIAFAIACAASIAGYHLCYDRALHAGAAPAPVFAVALGVALPIVWATFRGRAGAGRRPDGREALRWCLVGALATASFLLFLGGLARSGAGPALTLRNTAVVFAQVLAAAMGEPVPGRQIAGSALVVAGAALLSWP
jgi:drug/metabolite transporter (DMT)-like permease